MSRRDVTEDALLCGRVRLLQPRRGYRAAVDPVFLAAAVPARTGERVVELGLGTGAAALCLARRVDGIEIVGLERDPVLAALAERSVALNGMDTRVRVVSGDVLRPPRALRGFDHAMANPPFLAPDRGDSRRPGAAPGATREGAVALAAWIAAAHRMLRQGGSFTIVHRADRLGEILALLAPRFGGVVVFPLWPKDRAPAKRVLVRARKGARAPLSLAPGLVLHGPGGRFTPEAERVLSEGCALPL